MIITPAGTAKGNEELYIKDTVQLLTSWGLDVRLSEHYDVECGKSLLTKNVRSKDLMSALTDPQIKAIFCSRGGYGSAHLLSMELLSVIAENPKWLIGFSDVSALLSAWVKAGVMALHAPMSRYFSKYSNNISIDYIRQTLFTAQQLKYIIEPHTLNRTGRVYGKLYGGNMSVLSRLIATPYDMFQSGTILFIEDTNEPPRTILGILDNLEKRGILKNILGLIIGQFTNYNEDLKMGGRLLELIQDSVSCYDFPVCYNFPVGHDIDNYPLIVGSEVSLFVEPERVILSPYSSSSSV